jgi:hypothetical protein
MGQKMVRFAQLGAARFRQGESIEVGGVGSKRPSSGGNGGHVVSLYPLTWRSLCAHHRGAHAKAEPGPSALPTRPADIVRGAHTGPLSHWGGPREGRGDTFACIRHT